MRSSFFTTTALVTFLLATTVQSVYWQEYCAPTFTACCSGDIQKISTKATRDCKPKGVPAQYIKFLKTFLPKRETGWWKTEKLSEQISLHDCCAAREKVGCSRYNKRKNGITPWTRGYYHADTRVSEVVGGKSVRRTSCGTDRGAKVVVWEGKKHFDKSMALWSLNQWKSFEAAPTPSKKDISPWLRG